MNIKFSLESDSVAFVTTQQAILAASVFFLFYSRVLSIYKVSHVYKKKKAFLLSTAVKCNLCSALIHETC